ncbi:MAG: asparagine synthase (glutamine-hydrolyzing) [Candidatus Methanoperedens sp.]|nr:asparagine synthase (glutamine-hydrolyzing) [Candidatus Methanoperedens sp.]
MQRHRGPDDEGHYINNSIGLGHRRLSIIDLSPAGHQPMCNEDGNIWITYNGEIYNYLELTLELKEKGHVFKSGTDTEVIIHAYEEYDQEFLHKLNGMFAFAIWDDRKKKLFCARDRFGIKPFYYYLDERRFHFASEIKAIITDITIERNPNDKIIYDYLAHDLLDHTEDTFFKGIKCLLPAHYLVIEDSVIKQKRYWDLDPTNNQNEANDEEYTRKFFELFKNSVKLRLRSDVPVGTCLSGGLDSSSIACIANDLLKELTNEPQQKTFSSCFDEKEYDEREFINLVLDKTGAEGNFIFPNGNDLFDLIEDIIRNQDEPFVSTSIFAQWHVMKLAKYKGVKVILDGQGADELLAGYYDYYYSFFADLIKTLKFIKLIKEINLYSKYHHYSKINALISVIFYLSPNFLKKKFKYLERKKGWLNSEFVKANKKDESSVSKYNNNLNNHLYDVLRTGLPSLLRYEDRNSMAFSIESRVPFLDYRFVEFIFSLPNNQKIDNGMTKVILRNAMKDILPENVRNRKDKMGFVTPENIWFRTFAKDKIVEIIRSKRFIQRKYFNILEIKKEFEAHCNGEKNIGSTIWRWINLELWMRMFID